MFELRGFDQGVQISGGGGIAGGPGSMLSGCASHIFRRAMRIQGSHTLQRRPCGTVHKLPDHLNGQARPQIFRVGLLKKREALPERSPLRMGYYSQLIHIQLEVLFSNRRASTLAHDRSQAGRRTRQNCCHTTQPPTVPTLCHRGNSQRGSVQQSCDSVYEKLTVMTSIEFESRTFAEKRFNRLQIGGDFSDLLETPAIRIRAA